MQYLDYKGLEHYHSLLLGLFAEQEQLKDYYTKSEADLLHTSLLVYKGNVDIDNLQEITTSYEARVGWTYIISGDDMFDLGYEKGDMLVCIQEGNPDEEILPQWQVIQSNVSLYTGCLNLAFGATTELGIVNGNTLSLSMPSLPVASSSSLGCIKLGYTENENNYAVKIDSNNKAFVTVPTLTGQYLPLTGGTMSGDITMSGETKLIFGDISVYNNGNLFIDKALQVDGNVTAFGFRHATHNSDDYVLLAGGGAKHLSEIKSDVSGYLPLTGGDMSGAIGFDGDCGVIEIIETDGHARVGWLRVYGEDGVAIEGQTHIDGPLEVSGDVEAAAFYETSDIRKKDIKSDISLEKCYDVIDKCQTIIYSLKDQTKEQVGLIAQEIEEFFPEVVATDKEGFKSLAYDRLVVICFKVLKDVIKRLEKLEQ